MKQLLEIREKLKSFYAGYAAYIDRVGRFLLALAVFWAISHKIGYFTGLANPVVILALALICMLLPVNLTALFAAILITAHAYKLSIEVMAVTMALLLILYILYLRFSPRAGVVVLLLPLLCWIKLPGLLPIALGLLCTPASAPAACCGVVVSYLLRALAGFQGTEETAMGTLSAFTKEILQNKEMYLMLAAVLLVILVVYAIRTSALDYAWYLAIGAGVLLWFFVMLFGSLLFSVSVSVGSLLLGTLLSLLAALFLAFFFFTVDYSKAKQLQFEDDEYYYYVKAVPKVTVAPAQKEVTHFNHWKSKEGQAVLSRVRKRRERE